MKKFSLLLFLLLATASCPLGCTPTVSREKQEAIRQFIKTEIVDSLEQDYRSHGMTITVVVTDIAFDRLTKREMPQDNRYDVLGRASYVIKGKRAWRDREGNLVTLGPEQAITHWFTCGILEDRYLGTLRRDDRNRLSFYADKPES